MIHSGSRGFGHQVATDALIEMEKTVASQRIPLNDRQVRMRDRIFESFSVAYACYARVVYCGTAGVR